MPRILSWIPTVALMLALASPAAAVTVVVPDDHPTIQSALDAGADVIQVRDGLAPERLTVRQDATIEPANIPFPGLNAPWISMPSIQSITVDQSGGGESSLDLAIRRARFLGNVSVSFSGGTLVFEGCRFDSGLAGPTAGFTAPRTSVRGCLFLGGVSIRSAYTQFIGNTVIGGGADLWSDGTHDIRHNYVQGPAAAGLELSLRDSDGPVAMNTVRGTVDGISFVVRPGGQTVVIRNDISDCEGDGIVYREIEGNSTSARCDSNRIQRCGGAGIAIRGTPEFGFSRAQLNGNAISKVGQEGVYLDQAFAFPVRGNTILDSGKDGFVALTVLDFEGNLIAQNAGAGMRITSEIRNVIGNTLVSNGGAGILLENEYGFGQIKRNVSAFNGGAGLVLKQGQVPEISCNDFFGNGEGPLIGVGPRPGNLFVDPLFCDLGGGDYHLASNSPLLAGEGCGLIGALGEGCGPLAVLDATAPGAEVGFRATPVPSRGTVALSLPPSLTQVEIEVFDVTGARRWQTTLPAGTRTTQWDRNQSAGQAVPPGVYFARLSRGDQEIARARIVLTD